MTDQVNVDVPIRLARTAIGTIEPQPSIERGELELNELNRFLNTVQESLLYH